MKNKATGFSNNMKKQTIFTKREVKGETECRTPGNVADTDLSVETPSVMNSFLHKTLGSTLLKNNDCDENKVTSNSAEEKNRSYEIKTENKVEYPHLTLSGYRAMTRTNPKTRPPVPSVTFYVKELKQFEKERILKYVETLQDDATSQKNILQQVTKALTYCCSSENSRISAERMECERFLLLALHKYTAMMKKIGLLKTDIRNGCKLKAEKGTVTISNLVFTFNQQLYTQNEEQFVWVMCLLSHEEIVMATDVKLLKEDFTVKFQNAFTFNNLLNDFKINIQLFSLSLKKGNRMPKKYLKKLLSTHSRRMQSAYELIDSPILTRQAIFKTPDFLLKGSFIIELGNLKSSLTQNEFQHGQMQMSLSWDVESKVETSGFLTVREDTGEYHTWERRWCFLESCKLKYWNYPADRENMSPLQVLDLRQCICTSVEPLDRSLCSRPRTFLLEMVEGKEEVSQINDMLCTEKQTVKYMFSTDTSKDLQQWCMVLTKNLQLLNKWKKI